VKLNSTIYSFKNPLTNLCKICDANGSNVVINFYPFIGSNYYDTQNTFSDFTEKNILKKRQ